MEEKEAILITTSEEAPITITMEDQVLEEMEVQDSEELEVHQIIIHKITKATVKVLTLETNLIIQILVNGNQDSEVQVISIMTMTIKAEVIKE